MSLALRVGKGILDVPGESDTSREIARHLHTVDSHHFVYGAIQLAPSGRPVILSGARSMRTADYRAESFILQAHKAS